MIFLGLSKVARWSHRYCIEDKFIRRLNLKNQEIHQIIKTNLLTEDIKGLLIQMVRKIKVGIDVIVKVFDTLR